MRHVFPACLIYKWDISGTAENTRIVFILIDILLKMGYLKYALFVSHSSHFLFTTQTYTPQSDILKFPQRRLRCLAPQSLRLERGTKRIEIIRRSFRYSQQMRIYNIMSQTGIAEGKRQRG